MALSITLPQDIDKAYTSPGGVKFNYLVQINKIDNSDTETTVIINSNYSFVDSEVLLAYKTVTHKVTNSNYNTYQTDIEQLKNSLVSELEGYLNTLIGTVTLPSYTKSRDVTSTVNGITYTVAVEMTVQYVGGKAESTYDSTSANINATIKWKTKGSKFAYEEYYDGTLFTVTASNYGEYNTTNKAQLVTTIDNKINNDLVPKVLDKLIGVVATPKGVETTFKSTDELKTVYVRTTVTGANSVQNATSCTLYCTTVAGVDENYGMTYATDVPFTITPSNYQDWQNKLAEFIESEQKNVKNTDFFKMLSIAIPTQISRTNYTTNNGLVYNYTITCTQGSITVDSNQINYVTVIKTNSYTMTWSSKSVTFDLYDTYYKYSNASKVFTDLLTNEEAALKDYLDELNFTTIQKIKIVTDYGYTDSYGTKLAEMTYNIVYSNYSSYYDNICAIGDAQYEQIFDLKAFKVYNVALPDNFVGVYIKNAATVGGVENYGIIYHYKVEFSMIKYTDTHPSYELVYNISYGATDTTCNTNYYSNSITVNESNYETVASILEAEVEAKIVDLKNHIKGLALPSLPKQETQATIKMTTDYGIDTEYGNSLGSVTYLVKGDNFITYLNAIDDITETQKDKFTTTNLFKLYNVVKPTDIFQTVVKDSEQFTYGGTKYNAGIIYKYEVIFNQGATTGSTNEIEYQINYGSSKAYDTVFTKGSIVFNITNYNNAITTLLQEVQGKLDELEAYIDSVAIPEDHYRPTKSATVNVNSEFGLNENYGISLGNSNIVITPGNYKNYSTLITNRMEEQENNINNIELFKMLDMELPDPIVKTYTPSTNGIKFSYKITPSFYQVSETEFTFRCTTLWDQYGTYKRKYTDKDVVISINDRTSAYVKIYNKMLEVETEFKNYLDTLLPMLPAIDDYTQKIDTTSGVLIWVRTTGYVVEDDLEPKYTIKFTTTYDMNANYHWTYSKDQIFEVNASTYSNWSNRYAARVSEEQLKIKTLNVYKMLCVALPAAVDKTATINNVKYRYKIIPLQGEADFNTNSFKYTVYWNEGSLDNIFTTKTIIFNQTNYSGAASSFTNTFGAEESALKTYLGSLTFVHSETVRLVTDYGLDTNYGNALSTVDHEIDAAKYKTYAQDLLDAGTREQNTIKDTNAYHVLNVAKPSDISNSKTATNGQKYYYRFRYEQSTTSLTANKINYVLEYGLNTNYGSTYTSGSFDFNANNYASAATTMENTSNQKIADLLRFFDNIIGVVTLPNTVSDSWSTNSTKTMNVRTRFEIASSVSDSEVSSEKDSITVKYITEYSLDNSYGTNWSTKTYAITPGTYNGFSKALTDLAKVEQKALQDSNIMKMLNIVRPEVIDDNFVATNGIIYNYSAKFVQDDATLAKNKIIVVLWYGTSSNPNIVYSQVTKEFTPTNCANATAELTATANTQITNLKTYLNNYVPSDDIVIPNAETYTYTSKSGKKFYLKTTFTKGDHSDTQCVIRYITVWGFTGTYGNTYSDKTHTITPNNYRNYTDTLIELAHQEFEKCELAKFGVWDVVLPNNSNETYTTKGKDTYFIKSTFENFETDNQTNTIKYIVTYGTSLATNTANLWSENIHIVTDNNVSGATNDIKNLADAEVARLEEFLESPNVVLPNDTEITHTVYGFKYNLQVIHSKGAKGNIVITTAKVDGNTFGDQTTTTFLSQKDVDATLENLVTTKMNEMKAKCDLSPANKSETHTVGDSQFTIETEFVKNPGVVQASCITKLDGVEYKRVLVNINANSIEANLQNIASTGENNVNALKGVLANMPVTNSSIHTSGGFNFDITVTYTKAVHSNVVHYIIASDNSVYDSNDYLLDATVLSNTISDLTATVTAKVNELKRKLTNASPGNSSEILTYNGFQYLVGVEYSKAGSNKNASVKVMIDNVKFNEYSKLVDQSTIDNDMITIIAKGNEIRASLLNLINQSPANKSYIHPVNGFNYTVGTEYSKSAGNQNVTIETLLDGRVYSTLTRTIESTNIATNLNECILAASNNELELKKILNTSPADSNRSVFSVQDIKYYVGATFSKVSTNNVVTVAIMLDNEAVETYSENILAESVAADIDRIKAGAQDRVDALKENLNGLTNSTVDYTKNGFNFKLAVEYSKDLENRTITINTKVDNVLYGTPYTATFNKDNIEDYKIKANNLLENIKSVLNNVPENISNEYAVNGFNFNVGIAYEKAAENATVQIFTVLDGVRFDDPTVVNFNMDNIGLISEKGLSELAILKERLKSVPANYSNIFTVGGLEFRISTNFAKAANSNLVQITTAVDGENYGTAATKVFDINDIGSISLETNDREEEIKDILRGAPEDSAEVYTIRRLNFNIQKIYQKSAGSKLVTSMVKMDGNQYEQTHQEEYNITDLGALTSYNDALVASLKNKLTNSIPNDIHTTYTRNQFTFVVDIYFTKSVNSDVINVEYYIDSADLANTLH